MLPLGGVENHAVDPGRVPAWITHHPTALGHPPGVAVGVDDAVFDQEMAVAIEILGDLGCHTVCIVRVDNRCEAASAVGCEMIGWNTGDDFDVVTDEAHVPGRQALPPVDDSGNTGHHRPELTVASSGPSIGWDEVRGRRCHRRKPAPMAKSSTSCPPDLSGHCCIGLDLAPSRQGSCLDRPRSKCTDLLHGWSPEPPQSLTGTLPVLAQTVGVECNRNTATKKAAPPFGCSRRQWRPKAKGLRQIDCSSIQGGSSGRSCTLPDLYLLGHIDVPPGQRAVGRDSELTSEGVIPDQGNGRTKGTGVYETRDDLIWLDGNG